MPIQMRLSQADERFYNPDRDLAYCTPHLLHRVTVGLNPENQEVWIRQYLKDNNVNDEQLIEAATILARYLNTTLLDPKYKTPFDALHAVKFFELPQPVQIILCAKIGQVFISAFFSAIRDVTRTPDKPPVDLSMIAAEAAKLQSDWDKYNSRSWLTKCLKKIWVKVRNYLTFK